MLDPITIKELNVLKAHAAIVVEKVDKLLGENNKQNAKIRKGLSVEEEAKVIAAHESKRYKS